MTASRGSSTPPWLRFHAYVVGLPKTGSTSLAAVFSDYRTAHEFQMMALMSVGVAWAEGRLTEEQFWERTGARLLQPRLELDSATCHHLYTDLLATRHQTSVFLHPIRDVRSWVNSMLDMSLRLRRVRRLIGLGTDDWHDGVNYYTGLPSSFDPHDDSPDLPAVLPLMERWGQHMTRLESTLPADRTIRFHTSQIHSILPELADRLRIPLETLHSEAAHANASPITFDRFRSLTPHALRDGYSGACREAMERHFPSQHEEMLLLLSRGPDPQSWSDHVSATDVWAEDAVARHGHAAAR